MSVVSRLRYRVALLATLLLFLSALVAGGAVYYRQQQIQEQQLENLTWMATQLDREARESRIALLSASVSRPEEFLLRYEILISRATLLQQGSPRQALKDTPMAEVASDAIEAVLAIDPLIEAIETGERLLDPPLRRELDAKLTALQSITSTLLIDTHAHVSSLRYQERSDLMRLYGLVLGLIVLLMAAGCVLTALLVREGHKHATKSKKFEELARELEVMAQRAEKASQAKSEFMAVMSHEMRTPLNGVVGVADLMADEPLPPTSRKLLTSLNDSVLGLQSVINDVIDYTRYENGQLELESAPFATRTFIGQLTRSYRLQAQQRWLTFQCRVASDIPPVLQGDVARLRQVLMNLLNNALKFTVQGSVSLAVERGTAGETRFLVRDTGCGIPQDRRAALFQPFSQVDASITRKYGGSGLGLAICKQLVSIMNGQIGMESQEGRGSLFWVEVPLPEGSLAHDTTVPHENPPPTLAPRRVLVVEDNATNRELVCAMLERLGQQSRVAENGQAALTLLYRESFDLVLMDMQMPVMDGITTTRHWRQKEAASQRARLPIIALTANIMPEDRERCLAAGMDDVLGKPFTRYELHALLAAYSPAPSPATSTDAAQVKSAARAGSEGQGQTADAVWETETTQETETPAGALLDLQALTMLEESLGLETLQELMSRFMERLAERQTGLQASLSRDDRHALSEAAHALKGAASSMGCQGLAQAAAELETSSREAGTSSSSLALRVSLIAQLSDESRAALEHRGYLLFPRLIGQKRD